MSYLERDFNVKRNKHVSKDKIKLSKEFKRSMIINKIIQTILILILIGIGLLIAYISYYGPIKTNLGWVKPGRGTAKISNVVVFTDENDSMPNRLKEAIVEPPIYVGEIIAGPYGVLSGEEGSYIVNDIGKEIPTKVELKNHDKFLREEYIVKCTYGDCEAGEEILIKKDRVKGKFNDSDKVKISTNNN